MPDQRSLAEQLQDLIRFARVQKMYDAVDFLTQLECVKSLKGNTTDANG